MFIGFRELKSLFAGSNPRKIDGGATLTAAAVDSIAGEAVQLVPASTTRRRVTIQNISDELVAVGPATVTLASGSLLKADTQTTPGTPDGDGGVITLLTQAAVYAIATTAGEVRVLVEAD